LSLGQPRQRMRSRQDFPKALVLFERFVAMTMLA